MLFRKETWGGIADGSVTLAFRRWERPRLRAGSRLRTPAGIIVVDSVDVVDPASITPDEAARAGTDLDDLLGLLEGRPGPVHRVEFHRSADPDPRAELASDSRLTLADVAEIAAALTRADARSGEPWTAATLSLIAAHPGRRAGDLAEMAGRERLEFKRDVRTLKELGLTLSLPVGYRISPRGEAYLRTSGP